MSTTTDPVLDRLKNGIRRFQTEVYPEHSGEYEVAATTPQKPHTLIIACSDSRIDVETITSSKPGEIFFSRNVGNIVPTYGDAVGGVAAVIEYAINALKVKHAVVCGHSDCGAMKALKGDVSKLNGLPMVQSWLGNAADARANAALQAKDEEIPLRSVTEQNVLLQLAHLETHPAVRGAMERGELTISGWIYDIGSGDVLIHDRETGQFHSTLGSHAAVGNGKGTVQG